MAAKDVSGLVLHANGTSLGDPIEVCIWRLLNPVLICLTHLSSIVSQPFWYSKHQKAPAASTGCTSAVKFTCSTKTASLTAFLSQVGAVVEAYQLQRKQAAATASNQPEHRIFALTTIKGYAGHSEAASGVVGVLEAVSSIVAAAQPPVLHLRTLNPYASQPLTGRDVALNRGVGLAPLPITSPHGAAGVAVGVSSFGAQGACTLLLTDVCVCSCVRSSTRCPACAGACLCNNQ